MRELSVVVTGVSRGLGRALAEQLATSGAFVVGLSRSKTTVSAPNFIALRGDLSNAADVGRVRDALGDRPLDLLVNNAAVGGKQRELSADAVDELRRALDVNVIGTASLTAALLPALRRATHPLVLNLGSRMGDVRFNRSLPSAVRPASYAYRISKAGVEMLALALARELGSTATVLCIDPGPMRTAMGRPEAERDPETVASELIERLAEFRALESGSTVSLVPEVTPS